MRGTPGFVELWKTRDEDVELVVVRVVVLGPWAEPTELPEVAGVDGLDPVAGCVRAVAGGRVLGGSRVP